GLALLATVAPLTGSPVLLSVTIPATRPPGMGAQVRVPTNTLSSSHHQPKLLVKWNRTFTLAFPAACGIGMSICPVTEVSVCSHTLVQVCPPSILRSTSAVLPGNSLQKVSKPISGELCPDRLTT